jgi:predicted ester cyclase
VDDETERNKAVVRRFIEEVQNEKNWASYDELNAPDFVNLSAPPGVPSDREGGKMFLGAFLNAFPDCQLTIDDMIAEGDRVATKKTFSGTHTGESTESHRLGGTCRSRSSTSCALETARSWSTG